MKMNTSEKPSTAARSLSVGLSELDPAWCSLLDSQGVSCVRVASDGAGQCAPEVLVLTAACPAAVRRRCCDLIAAGASAIVEPGAIDMDQLQQRTQWSEPFESGTLCALDDADDPEALAIVRGMLGRGAVFVLPFRLGRLWADHSYARRHVVVGPGRLIYEEMAAVVKRNVRRVVIGLLRRSFVEIGLPFVHKWFYPGRHRSVFCIRGDADGGPRENLEKFIDAVANASHCASLFFCTSRYRDKQDLIAKARDLGIEIGSHNHWHIVFPDRWTNARSLGRAERLLTSLGCRPRGFVAPAYFWNPTLYHLLEQRGYAYTSCFRLSHDSLPYYPVVQGRVGNVLEIPFHCLGDRFARFDMPMASYEVRRFFEQLLDAKYAACEPMHIHGHPDVVGRMGEAPELVRFIIETACRHADVWTPHLIDYTRWWQQRRDVVWHPQITLDSGRIACRIESGGSADGALPRLCVEQQGKTYLLDTSGLPMSGAIPDEVDALSSVQPTSPTGIGEVVRSEGRVPPGQIKRTVKRFLCAYWRAYVSDPDAASAKVNRPVQDLRGGSKS